MSILTMILAFLPTILQLVTWILGKANADAATKKAWIEFIQKAKLDPAISLQMKDNFKAMEEELKAGGGQ